MKTRFLLGAVLVAALIGVYWLDASVFHGKLLTRLLLWVLALGALREVLQVIGKRLECAPGLFPTGAIAAVVILIPALIESKPVNPTLLVVAGVFAGGIRLLHMAAIRSAPVAFPEAAALSGAFFYTIGLFHFLDRLVLEDLRVAFLVVAISKSSDICAYLVGSWIGKRPLAPALSPKKTRAGGVAAIVGPAAVAALFPVALSGHDMPPLFAALIGAIVGAASMMGDLIASGLKRWASVKDSAAILPEFGGMLDLVDGVLIAAPVAVICLMGA